MIHAHLEERRAPRRLAVSIENASSESIAVLHPESPAGIRAFVRAHGELLRLLKIAAQPPAGMHVSAVPAPFVAILGPGAVLEEHLLLDDPPPCEYDPMYAVTFYRDHPAGSGDVSFDGRRLVHAVELVIEYLLLSPSREVRAAGPEQLLHPGITRAEIATTSATIALSEPIEVVAYSWAASGR